MSKSPVMERVSMSSFRSPNTGQGEEQSYSIYEMQYECVTLHECVCIKREKKKRGEESLNVYICSQCVHVNLVVMSG